ncbi:MAG: substrate-binding domain-containing protein [Actinobacteria bacterium]|nr:substrate-binding domain-containing protein [Actinomycetota bacterium]
MVRKTMAGRWYLALLMLALVAVLGVVAAGCGGGGSSSSSESTQSEPAEEEGAGSAEEGEAEDASAGSAEVTPATEELMSKAIGVPYEEGEFEEVGIEAFNKAAESLELTPAQEKLAFECWEKSSCTLGSGELTLGVADGFGGNTWRKMTKMESILQAMTYPEIGKYVYLDAEGDLAKMQANIRSLSAQGAQVILTYDDFGTAVVPAYQAAQRAGAVISNYVGPVDGASTDALTSQVVVEWCQTGKTMADSAAEVLHKKGSIALFGGPPGNPEGEVWWGCAEEELSEKYPELSVSYKGDTEWTPASAAKAASAAIASGKPIDAILYDYAEPSINIVEAYEKAGKTPPAIIAVNQSNGLVKNWSERQGTKNAYALEQTSSLAYASRISLTALMRKVNGEEVPAEIALPVVFVPADKSQYEQGKPGSFPGPTVLVPNSLVEKMLAAG